MEVFAEMALEHSQHRCVAVIDGGAFGLVSSFVLAAECFSQKSYGIGRSSVPKSSRWLKNRRCPSRCGELVAGLLINWLLLGSVLD